MEQQLEREPPREALRLRDDQIYFIISLFIKQIGFKDSLCLLKFLFSGHYSENIAGFNLLRTCPQTVLNHEPNIRIQ